MSNNQKSGQECQPNVINGQKPRLSTKYDRFIGATRDLLYDTLTSDKKYFGSYYQFDLKRAMKDDFSVRRFLLKSSGSVDSTVASMISTFQWIKSNKLRELKQSDFPIEFHSMGPVFQYIPDAAGRPTVYFRIKCHIPVKEMVKLKMQYVSWLILQADDLAGDLGMTAVVDLTNLSLINVDLEMSLTLAEIRHYFPHSAASVFMIDLPLIARAAYNVVKYILPSEIKNVMNCIKKEDLSKYIPIDNIPSFLGGKCKKPYAGPNMVPEGCISLAEYAQKFLNLTPERSEKITKLHLPVIESVKSECQPIDANGNAISQNV